MEDHVQSPTKVLIVLTGSEKSGGASHQTEATLRFLLGDQTKRFDFRVVDVDFGFTAVLDELLESGKFFPENLVRFGSNGLNVKERISSGKSRGFSFLRMLLGIQYVHPVARQIDLREEKLVVFASQSELAARINKAFVWTLWDIAHLDSPEFEEVRSNGEFERRDRTIWAAARKAALVIVDSPNSVNAVSTGFGVPFNRLIDIPFSPSSTLSQSEYPTQQIEVPSTVGNELPEKFFFYPAQFWTHKNHEIVVDAIDILRRKGIHVGIVFAGGDRGNKSRIVEKVRILGLEESVRFLGYVSDSIIGALYRSSVGLIMASYFGPTNIPPLEAFALGVPVVASEGHRSQLKDGAVFFDPDSQVELAKRLEQLLNPDFAERLRDSGAERLKEIEARRQQQQHLFLERLDRIANRVA